MIEEWQVIAFVAVVLSLVVAISALVHWVRRIPYRAFVEEYGDVLPAGAQVRRHVTSTPGFQLAYPRWTYARKDGCRDMRRTGNVVIRSASTLDDGELRVSIKNPFRMYTLVLHLREAGVDVPMCTEERLLSRTTARARSLVPSVGGNGRPGVFSGTPLEFEYFCAEVFATHGYATQPTGAGSDGGVDIRMKKDGESFVVECKLYAAGSNIGRPMLQKLIGAQYAEGADHSVFITTSAFSRPAVEYAAQMGMLLVDGAMLAQMSRPLTLTHSGAGEPPGLTADDIWDGYPADLRRRSDR